MAVVKVLLVETFVFVIINLAKFNLTHADRRNKYFINENIGGHLVSSVCLFIVKQFLIISSSQNQYISKHIYVTYHFICHSYEKVGHLDFTLIKHPINI